MKPMPSLLLCLGWGQEHGSYKTRAFVSTTTLIVRGERGEPHSRHPTA